MHDDAAIMAVPQVRTLRDRNLAPAPRSTGRTWMLVLGLPSCGQTNAPDGSSAGAVNVPASAALTEPVPVAPFDRLSHRDGGPAQDAVDCSASAVELNERACNAKTYEACIAAATCIIEKDPGRGFALVNSACDAGVGDACLMTGVSYLGGIGVKEDAAKAHAKFAFACDKGTREACPMTAGAYLTGEGAPKDPKKGIALLERYCDEDPGSCSTLALMYRSGKHVPQDLARARELFERAAKAGNHLGDFGLGLLYENGEGVTRDVERARGLYQNACRRGLENACAAEKGLADRK